jgi:short-subunit dehydrogenase
MMKFLSHASATDVANNGFKLMMKGKSFSVHGFMNKLMIFSNRFASRGMSIGVAAKLMKVKKE